MSPCMERMTQRSSTISAWCGNRSETSMPRLAVLLERALGAQNARLGIDVLILHFAEFGRALLAVQLVEQRLGVEGLQVRRPARHEQEDERLRLGLVRHVRRLGRERIVARRARLRFAPAWTRRPASRRRRSSRSETRGDFGRNECVRTYQFTYRNAFRLKTARANSFTLAGSSGCAGQELHGQRLFGGGWRTARGQTPGVIDSLRRRWSAPS